MGPLPLGDKRYDVWPNRSDHLSGAWSELYWGLLLGNPVLGLDSLFFRFGSHFAGIYPPKYLMST